MQDVTIYDIAKMANLSPSTVSRVANNRPGVKKETRELVLKLLKEHSYMPNEIARGLVTQSSKMIGILISDVRTTHHTDGVFFLERELSKNEYSCLIYNTGTAQEDQARYFQALGQRNVDAAVLMGSIYQTETVRDAILKYIPSTPVFICNGYLDLPNIYGVTADDQNGVCSCVRLLADKGRKHLAFVLDHYTPSNLLKKAGFEIGVAQFCDDRNPLIIKTGASIHDAYDALQQLMREHPKTDGIVFSEDVLAMIGLRVLAEMDISVPSQVSIIGINNSKYAEISTPTLTSLDNMLYDLSLTIARNIIELLKGQRINKRMMIYSQIVERQST